ncbi:MAG: GNAT family N-acetyltransferase [Roseiflexaceae bacterium]|nr:GNAT family N-acetyltransferase [Roseiflexaceae bacterium]
MSDLSPTIERAEIEHLDLLVPLFNGYRQFYGQHSDLAGARRFLFERMAALESVVFLAHHGGRGLGFTQLYPSFSSVSLQRLWVLNDLFVAAEARGKGVAEALLERARAFGVATAAKELALSTDTNNTTAQRLYERLGYQRVEDAYAYTLRLPAVER